jgi:CRISPR-associated endoribonuclease Cas6
MKIEISVKLPVNKIIFYKDYRYIIQAAVYNLLPKEYAEQLHKVGYIYNRKYNLFVISGFFEPAEFDKTTGNIIFNTNILTFDISSIDENFIKQIGYTLSTKSKFRLDKYDCKIINYIEKDIHINTETICIDTTLEVHSFIDNKKYYHTPEESKFYDIIHSNLKNKFYSFYKQECPFNLDIKILGIPALKKKHYIKNNQEQTIYSWRCQFKLKADPKFLYFIINVGLGSSNSKGFGAIKILNNLN